MNDVIDRLAEIEAAAVKIAENTGKQKAELVKESEQKIREYDKQFQEKLDVQIEELKAANDKEIQNEIKTMHQNSIRAMEELEAKYRESHETVAKNIVKMLTGV